MYINDTYPEARRIFSRPFAIYLNRPPETQELSDFFNALYGVGESLIGDPFEICCDLDYANKKYAHIPAPFWHEQTISQFSKTEKYTQYIETLPTEVQSALTTIVDQIKLSYESMNKAPNHKTYDLGVLRKAFEKYWEHEILLDARLGHAEEMFAYAADKPEGRYHTYESFDVVDKERLTATLAWMEKPENAHRIAQTFLYSRIAQHLDETDPRSVKIAIRIMRAIDAGEGSKAAMLELAPKQKPELERREKGGLLQTVAKFLLKKKPVIEEQPETGLTIREPEAFARSIPHIIEDYKRLRDGVWAREKLQEIDNNAALPKTPQLVLTRAVPEITP